MKSKEEKVNRIINNLMQKTALKAKFKEVTLSQRMKQLRTPGVSIAVIKDYKIDWAEGFGVKEYGKNNPITEETLFQAGSLSKPIFALAVMRLVQEGKLDLDEDVNNYLTTFKIPKNGNWQPKVTLRQLLIHTAGLTVGGFYGYFPSEDLPNGNQMFKGEFPANHNPISVNLVPGTQFRYSGGGYVVAQQLLCDVLQKPITPKSRYISHFSNFWHGKKRF
jgi:CubicO group peptidase (beta-lactamase class C family)